MQTTLSCIPKSASLSGCASQRLMHIQAYRPVGHGGEHYGHLYPYLRGKLCFQAQGLRVYLHLVGLAPQIGVKLHRLTQRVDGGVCHLAGIEHQVVPVNSVALIVAHACEKHAAGLCLLEDVLNYLRAPVVVLPVAQRISSHGQRIGRAEYDAAMAAHAFPLAAPYLVILSIVVMGVKRALIYAHLALYAALRVSLDYELRWQISLHLVPLLFPDR